MRSTTEKQNDCLLLWETTDLNLNSLLCVNLIFQISKVCKCPSVGVLYMVEPTEFSHPVLESFFHDMKSILSHWEGGSVWFRWIFSFKKRFKYFILSFMNWIPLPNARLPKEKKEKKPQTFSCFVRAVMKSIPPWQYFKLIHPQQSSKKKYKSRLRLTFMEQYVSIRWLNTSMYITFQQLFCNKCVPVAAEKEPCVSVSLCVSFFCLVCSSCIELIWLTHTKNIFNLSGTSGNTLARSLFSHDSLRSGSAWNRRI